MRNFIEKLKPILILIGIIIFVFAILYLCYYLDILFYNILTWPWALANIIEKVKAPLEKYEYLRYFATAVMTAFAYWLYKVKKDSQGGQIIGMAEIVGGVVTILCCFNAKFDSNLLYALSLAGGVFLIVDGLELFVEKLNQEQNQKRKNKSE
jgi:hypothetical protein